MPGFINRIIRAAKLDSALYEEVKADRNALGQALGVVVLSSLATAAGGAAKGGVDFLTGLLLSLASWFFLAYLTYFIGTRLFPEPQTNTNPGELLRTVGFTFAPGILRIFGIIPVTTSPVFLYLVFLVTTFWMLIAMVVAVKQALDFKSTFRAIGVCFMGLILQTVIFYLLNSLLKGTMGNPT